MVTKRLAQAISQLRSLPEARQNEIAEILLDIAKGDLSQLSLTQEQWAEIRRRMEEPRRYASDAEVEEFLRERK